MGDAQIAAQIFTTYRDKNIQRSWRRWWECVHLSGSNSARRCNSALKNLHFYRKVLTHFKRTFKIGYFNITDCTHLKNTTFVWTETSTAFVFPLSSKENLLLQSSRCFDRCVASSSHRKIYFRTCSRFERWSVVASCSCAVQGFFYYAVHVLVEMFNTVWGKKLCPSSHSFLYYKSDYGTITFDRSIS